VLGLFAALTMGVLFPIAIVSIVLGAVALRRAGRSPQTQGGRGLAIAGIAVSGLSLLLGVAVVALVLLLPKENTHAPGTATSGTAATDATFREADRRIMAYEGQVAFGNTREAEQMAQRISRTMEGLMRIAGGGAQTPAPAVSLSDGHYLTHVEARQDHLCVLIHVPGLRHLSTEDKQSLLQIAWSLAASSTTKAYGRTGVKVGVGLRGALLYGGVAVGRAGEKKPDTSDVGPDALPDSLNALFQGPAATGLLLTEATTPAPTTAP
jgi:hypothetical protein